MNASTHRPPPSGSTRRIVLALSLWILLSGDYFVSCQSGTGGGDDDDFFNNAPVAFNSTLIATVGVPAAGFLRAGDPDGGTLTYQIIAGPSLGTVQLTNAVTGAYSYFSDVTGLDSFNFIAFNGFNLSNVATVTVSVNSRPLVWELLPGPVESLAMVLAQSGQNWPVQSTTVATTPDATPAFTVADPFNPDRRLVYTTGAGLRQSVDGGAAWTPAPLPAALLADAQTLIPAYSPFVPDLLYLVVNTPSGDFRLLRSTTGGTRWQLLSVQTGGPVREFTSGPLQADGAVPVLVRLGNGNGLKALDILD